MEPFFELLGETLLSSPRVTSNDTLVAMWSGSLALAGAGYVLLVMAGGLTVMGYETVQTRYALKQVAPRIAVGLVTASLSLTVMDKAIGLTNALTAAIMDRELDGTGRGVAEMLLGGALSDVLLAGAPLGGMIHVALLAVVLLVLLIAVVIGYMVRAALIALLAVAGPLALACHALPQTEAVAKLWWRALAGCLVIQVAQATALAVAVRLYFAPGNTILGHPNPSQLETLLSGICLFWVLWKIPGWVVQVILRGGTPASAQTPGAVRMLRSIAIALLLRRFLAGGRAGASKFPLRGGLPPSSPSGPGGSRLALPPGPGPGGWPRPGTTKGGPPGSRVPASAFGRGRGPAGAPGPGHLPRVPTALESRSRPGRSGTSSRRCPCSGARLAATGRTRPSQPPLTPVPQRGRPRLCRGVRRPAQPSASRPPALAARQGTTRPARLRLHLRRHPLARVLVHHRPHRPLSRDVLPLGRVGDGAACRSPAAAHAGTAGAAAGADAAGPGTRPARTSCPPRF